MRSVNRVFLLGNLGRDAEVKFSPDGVSVSNFSIATNRRVKDGDGWREETDWHECVMWRSEAVAPYLVKGKTVHVEGRLQTRSWDDKDGKRRYKTEVIVGELMLLGGGEERAEEKAVVAPAPRLTAPAQTELGITDDDVPF